MAERRQVNIFYLCVQLTGVPQVFHHTGNKQNSMIQQPMGSIHFITDTTLLNQSPPLTGETIHAAGTSAPGFHMGFSDQPDWYFFVLFLLISGMAVAQVYFAHLTRYTVQSAFRFNITVNLYKDNSQVQRQVDNILYMNYFISFGFFLFRMAEDFGLYPFGIKGVALFLLLAGFLLLFFFFRIVLLNIAGHFFNRLALYREYLYHLFTYNKLIGLLILPLNVAIVYVPPLIKEYIVFAAFAVVGSILAMKLIRAIVFSLKRGVLNFYLFLYLCALELVPILLIYKYLSTIL